MNSVRSPDSGSKLLTALIEKYRNTEREGKTDLFTVLVKSEYRETLNRSLPRSYQRGSLQQKRHKGQEIGIWRQSCSWEIRILVSGFLQAAHLHSSWNFPWGILTLPSYNMTLHMFFSLWSNYFQISISKLFLLLLIFFFLLHPFLYLNGSSFRSFKSPKTSA